MDDIETYATEGWYVDLMSSDEDQVLRDDWTISSPSINQLVTISHKAATIYICGVGTRLDEAIGLSVLVVRRPKY